LATLSPSTTSIQLQQENGVVHLDGCVEVEAAYYGAPPGWIGRVVRVQWDESFVRLLDPARRTGNSGTALPAEEAGTVSLPRT
jgi:hypothetical protein